LSVCLQRNLIEFESRTSLIRTFFVKCRLLSNKIPRNSVLHTVLNKRRLPIFVFDFHNLYIFQLILMQVYFNRFTAQIFEPIAFLKQWLKLSLGVPSTWRRDLKWTNLCFVILTYLWS